MPINQLSMVAPSEVASSLPGYVCDTAVRVFSVLTSRVLNPSLSTWQGFILYIFLVTSDPCNLRM